MSVVSVFWRNIADRDLHLLPGLVSPRLDQLLSIRDDTEETADGSDIFRGDEPPPGATVAFTANFAGFPDKHGVTVDTQTGEVTIAKTLPAGPRLRSFIITVTVEDDATTLTLRKRFHIHAEIRSRWLTPPSLTVREGARNMRFSVLALFDDGVIGDISNWSPMLKPKEGDLTFVHRINDLTPFHRWTPNNTERNDLFVDIETGVITCAEPTATARVAVQIDLGNELARATAKGAPSWKTPVNLMHVQGPGFPEMTTEGVRNVLFLPDGFTQSEKAAFVNHVQGIVTHLNSNFHTRPFDILKDKFNYFLAWVPSPQAGVSVLSDLVLEHTATGIAARNLDQPSPADGTPDTLELFELIDTVGPPTPVFDKPGSPLGTDAVGRAHDWQRLYGPLPSVARTSGVYADWLAASDRVLLNECDTAFHVAHNLRPQVTDVNPSTNLALHPLRLHLDDFDAFLGALRDDKGQRLTNARGRKVWPPWFDGKKDDRLIVILSRTLRAGGTNSGRDLGKYLCVALLDKKRNQVRPNPNDDGYDLIPDAIPDKASIDVWTTIAHELAHSFNLDDEYGGGTVMTPAKHADVAKHANVQSRTTLLKAGSLDPEEIKWRWPRIEKAGLLVDRPRDLGRPGGDNKPPEQDLEDDDAEITFEDTGVEPTDDETDDDGDDGDDDEPGNNELGTGPFLLRLAPGHAGPFKTGDIIRLRRRPLVKASEPSDRLRVTKVDKKAATLEAELLAGSSLVVKKFPKGSIVMMPRRFASSVDGGLGADMELVHPRVLVRIQETHNPLNAGRRKEPDRECPGTAKRPTPGRNFPKDKGPKPPPFSSWIVGLFENGHGNDCEIYRPTGICIMSKPHFVNDKDDTQAYDFCMVCRYTMVDAIDPSRHGRIDTEYQYPQFPPT